MASVAQRFLECGVASPERRCVQLELPVASREPGREARSHELQHPPNVLRGHELPGPAQRVRPKDGALRDGALDDGVRRALGQTEPERPLRGSVVLGLDRPEPGDEIGRRREVVATDLLSVETAIREDTLRGAGMSLSPHPRLYYDGAPDIVEVLAMVRQARSTAIGSRVFAFGTVDLRPAGGAQWLAVRRSLLGVALGVVAALVETRVLASLIYGVSRTDR